MQLDHGCSFWLPGIIEVIASNFSNNEAACLRLVSKASCDALKKQTTIKLSQPVPVWAFEEHWMQPGACRSLTRMQRRHLVCLTAASNIVLNLEVALAATALPPSEEHLKAAAAAGAQDTLRCLAEPGRLTGRVDWWDVILVAAGRGQQIICDLIFEQQPHLRNGGLVLHWASAAAKHGHVSVMESLLAQAGDNALGDVDEETSLELFLAVLYGCNLATAQRVCQLSGGPEVWDGADWDENPHGSTVAAALGSPTPDWRAKAEWLITQGFDPSVCDYSGPRALPTEAGAAAVERFAWLKAKGCVLGGGAVFVMGPFVQAGHVAALEWLLAEAAQVPPQPDFFSTMLPAAAAMAAEEGHLAVLQLLAASPLAAAINKAAILGAAARGGRVEVLAWVFEAFRSDWDAACAQTPGPLTWAARSGSVEAIRWVHSHGGGVLGQEAAWSGAVESGCQAAVEVLAELGCPLPTDGSPYARALEQREWALLPLLHAQGVPMAGWAQERPELARALEAGAPAASLEALVPKAAAGSDSLELGLGPDSSDESEEDLTDSESEACTPVASEDGDAWPLRQRVATGENPGKRRPVAACSFLSG